MERKDSLVIAFDTSPLDSAHRIRGAGFYVKYLKSALEKSERDEKFIFFTRKQKLPKSYNIVHFPYFDPFFLTLPFRSVKNEIITIHDIIPILFPKAFPVGLKGSIKWSIQKRLARNARAIITDSERSKLDIQRVFGISVDDIHVIPLAAGEEFKQVVLSDSQKESLQRKYNLPEKFILYVGDATWNKNLPRLLEAVNSLSVPLVMVGKALRDETIDKDHPWNKDLYKVQAIAKHNKNIIRLGFVETNELVSLYNMAIAFVMPSLYEGFGLPVLEAMSCGTPVITTKEGSLVEVASDAAYYVDAYSISSIATGIEKVISDSSLQKKLKEKGFHRSKHFSWEKTALETLKVYDVVSSKYGKETVTK